MKKWYESKTVWLSIVSFLIGALGVLAEFLKQGDFSPYAVTLLVVGILHFVNRIWFTEQAIYLNDGNG